MAAEPVLVFSIPAQPLNQALVAFGRQAGVSVGLRDLQRCGGRSQAISGSYTPAAALAQLLAGTRCDFVALDAHAFRVAPRAEAEVVERKNPPATPEIVPSPPELLLDVVVTTNRRPSLISRTPASVSVASADFLGAGRSESLEELAPEFAGVTVTNLGPGRDKVLVRGLSDGAFTGRTQSTVGLYLDDVPITYNTPDPDLRLVDVERVELMRGPQGPLYGVGSMGGIVRIVTKKPDVERPALGLAVGAATTQSGAPSYSIDAMLNALPIPGRVALRGVAYTEVQGGYVDDTALSINNANRTRRTGARLAAVGVISPDWQVTVGATRQALRSDDSQYVEGGTGALARNGQVREPHQSDFTQAYVTVDGSTPVGQLRLSGALLDHAFSARSDASAGLALFGSLSTIGTYDQYNRINLAVAEAVLTSRSGRRLEWLAGVFASHTRESLYLNLSDVRAPPPVRPLYLEDRHDRLSELAVYGEASYALSRTLSFSAGLRASHTWQHTDSLRHQGVIPLSFTGAMDSANVAPKAVLSWQASPAKLFYIQAAQGYRTGGFNTTGRINQQFNATATGNQPNRQFRPDHLWSFEAGAKLALDERRLELRAAAFYTDWRDVQSDQLLPSGLPYTANVGRAVNTGFEGEGAFKVDHALTLRLNFLLAGPQLTQRDPTYPARPNASLPAVPRYSAALIGDWRRDVAPGVQALLYGRLSYVGASILTFQDQASSTMGNYLAARLSAGVQTARWRLTAYVDNPANTVGDTFAFGDPFTQGRVSQSTPLRPRTVGLAWAMGL
ncbi:MAG TPA: TonB-dependent receptor [Caulobacteraceae bacterium]|jgi:outer membrane receptor protein involved in Fe transport|nr:TonB-dependent receptor [Caulobacteraceae bacterium]